MNNILMFDDKILLDDVNYRFDEPIEVYDAFLWCTRPKILSELKKACKNNDINYVEYILHMMNIKNTTFDINMGLFHAVKYDNLELVKYCEEKGANDWDFVLSVAHTTNIVNYIKEKGSKHGRILYSFGFYYALKYNSNDYIDYYCSKVSIYDGLKYSIATNNKHYIEFYLEQAKSRKNDREWPNIGLRASAKTGNKELIEYFSSEGANCWSDCLIYCAKRNDKDLINFFVTKGANMLCDFEYLMITATKYNHQDLIEYCMLYGASNFSACLDTAVIYCYHNLVYFFLDKIGTGTSFIPLFEKTLSKAEFNHDTDMIELFRNLI